MTETPLEFSEILDECIEEVKASRLSVNDCLDRYPQFADELRGPLLTAELLRNAPAILPPETFKQQARSRLMPQLGPFPAGRISFFEALRQKWLQVALIPQSRRYSMAWMLALVIIGTALLGGGTAYASDAAVPGEVLYGLDRSLEEVRAGLTHDPEAFVAVQLAFADERLSEAQELASDQESKDFQEALNGYGDSIVAIAQKVKSAESIDLDAMSALLDEALATQDAKLVALSPQDDEDGQEDCDELSDEDCVENDEFEIGNSFCFNDGEHPVALKLAAQYEVDVQTVMDWFCGSEALPHFGFGQIMHALETERLLALKEEGDDLTGEALTAEQILALKAGGMGWGQIWRELDLKGKVVGDDEPEDIDGLTDEQRPVPPGQAKKDVQDGEVVPPGQAKKDGQDGETVPPGQAKKDGQDGETLPPGQAKKDGQDGETVPPGQAKKDEQPVPPGQAKKSGQSAPPGQAKKVDQPKAKKGK